MRVPPTADSHSLPRRANAVRTRIIDQAYRAGKGHIGSALSIVDVSVAAAARMEGLGAPDGDVLVLSKGHAALALYCTLHEFGLLTSDELDRYSSDGSALGTHPDPVVPGVPLMTGSLGQGVACAVGIALGIRLRSQTRRVIAVISDAELNEGSTWEALHIAAHHRLGNLAIILDANDQQAFGRTEDVQRFPDLPQRLELASLDVSVINGHDSIALFDTLEWDGTLVKRPRFVIATTISGFGVSFMEKSIPWHYLPLDTETHNAARAELETERSELEAADT